jgi:hypothetical protein
VNLLAAIAGTWTALSIPVALLTGRALRAADQREQAHR